MRYYYIPTTYRGRKFGCGLRGAGIRGFGTLYAGTLQGGAASIIDPQVIVNQLPEPAKTDAAEIITKAEETAKPVTIGKDRWSLWSSLKNAGKTVWNGAKTALDYAGKAYSNPLVRAGVNYALGTAARNYIPQIYTGLKKGIDNTGYSLYKSLGKRYGEQDQNLPLPPENYPTPANYDEDDGDFEHEYIDSEKFNADRKANWKKEATLKSIFNLIANYLMRPAGLGYYGGRRARFRKGSREAKAYMARLRSMRGRRRRMRRIGGSFKGVRNKTIKQLYQMASTNKVPVGTKLNMDVIVGKDEEGNPIFEKRDVRRIGDDEVEFEDANRVVHRIKKRALLRMYNGTNRMKKYFPEMIKLKGPDYRSNLMKEFHEDRKKFYEARPNKRNKLYMNMTQKRFKRMLNQLRDRKKDIYDYWKKRSYGLFQERWYPEEGEGIGLNTELGRERIKGINALRYAKVDKNNILPKGTKRMAAIKANKRINRISKELRNDYKLGSKWWKRIKKERAKNNKKMEEIYDEEFS